MRRVRLALLLLSTGLVACTSFEVIRPPERSADLYPHAETVDGLTIAVDELSDPERVKRYFGRDLRALGIRPVQVVVTNRGGRRILVSPADVLLTRGKEVVDPLPLEQVVALVARDGLVTTDGTEERIASYFRDVSLREQIVLPGESYQGVVFFHKPRPRNVPSRFFRVSHLFPQPALRLRLVATDVDDETRIDFGPYGLGPQGRGI